MPLGFFSLEPGQLEPSPSALPWIKQEEEAYEKSLRETSAYLCSGEARGWAVYLGL